MNKELSGIEFNDLYKNTHLIKLTNETELHNNFQFKDGLNIDTVDFNATKECSPGGIYFTEKNKGYMWLNVYYDTPMKYMRKVTIPDDARVYIEEDKFKTDKL